MGGGCCVFGEGQVLAGFREELSPDDVNARDVKCAEGAQDVSESAGQIVYRFVFAAEMPAGKQAILSAPAADRAQIAVKVEFGTDVVVVNALPQNFRIVGFNWPEQSRKALFDRIAFFSAEIGGEVIGPGDAFTEPGRRHCRFVSEGEANGFAEMLADGLKVALMRQSDKLRRHLWMQQVGIGSGDFGAVGFDFAGRISRVSGQPAAGVPFRRDAHHLAASAAGRPAALVVKPVVHVELLAFGDHAADDAEEAGREIVRTHAGRQRHRPEVLGHRMQAHAASAVAVHVAQLRQQSPYVKVVVEKPEVAGTKFVRRKLEVFFADDGHDVGTPSIPCLNANIGAA